MENYTLLDMFHDGGGWMYPLLLCSLFALGAIIAKGFTLWTAERRSKSLLAQVEELTRAGKIREAVQLTQDTPGPVAAVLNSGLRRHHQRFDSDEIEAALSTTGTIELGFLERGLVVLATVSNVAPLLGFLGTVAGMISAFGSIAAAGQVEATLVAGGIKVALITTAAGLAIAIPVNISYNYFVSRIDRLIRIMEEGTTHVLNLVWGQQFAVAGTAADPRHSPRPATGTLGRDLPDPGARPDTDPHQP